MDHQAIEKIQSLVHAAMIGNPGTDVPTLLVPDGYSLESLEKYQETPSRFRGTFTTESIEDYGNYVNSEDEARVFVDVEAMRAAAFFDLGNPSAPGHGEHRAYLKLEATGAYVACLSANGTSFAQKELAHWIEDWHHCIAGIDSNGQELTAKQLANSVRKIEIKATSERSHEEGDWNTKRSGMDALDANAGDATPDIIRFHCLPYEGLAFRTFEMRVSILTDDIKPKLKLRIIGLETAQEEMAKEFKYVLQGELDENATLLLGSFSK
ncbi:DUF2303 family protein [Vreelandella venusta]|uniref:DUF2303 family protein n=1 Tax=Vreelandella venusta TaxID=44935 RepID=UPI00200BE1ED|nr:DUF2303 family protein [Halomonas venusta]UQI38840.1 YfdQ family protein [Halomonas venusta]